MALNGHDVLLFGYHQAIDVGNVLIGDFLNVGFRTLLVIFRCQFVLDQFFDRVICIAADIADRHLGALAFVAHHEVDAAALGAAPGSLRVFEGEAMDRQVSLPAKSVHEVSLADLMDMVRLTGRLPERRALIGIEPAVIDWCDGLTPAVAAAVPAALRPAA